MKKSEIGKKTEISPYEYNLLEKKEKNLYPFVITTNGVAIKYLTREGYAEIKAEQK